MPRSPSITPVLVRIVLFGIVLFCAACTPAARQSLPTGQTVDATHGIIASQSAEAIPLAQPAPSATPQPPAAPAVTPTPTTEPSLTPTITPAFSAWEIVYQPDTDERRVAAVRWSADGNALEYALSPAPGGYLLEWRRYIPGESQTQLIPSPNNGFANLWGRVNLGYPRTVDPFSETLGFVSPEFTRAIYPNAGFPEVGTNPNYVFAVYADGHERQLLLGPTIYGVVSRAAWLDFETKVVFDYVYENRSVLYLADLLTGRTTTLYELAGENVEWRVSPDETYLLIPQGGESVLLPLNGGETLPAPGGMARPEWSPDSQKIYFWAGNETRILAYSLAQQAVSPVMMRRDLENVSPIEPVYGMPFTASPDGSRFAFWWENWIWIVTLAPYS